MYARASAVAVATVFMTKDSISSFALDAVNRLAGITNEPTPPDKTKIPDVAPDIVLRGEATVPH